MFLILVNLLKNLLFFRISSFVLSFYLIDNVFKKIEISKLFNLFVLEFSILIVVKFLNINSLIVNLR